MSRMQKQMKNHWIYGIYKLQKKSKNEFGNIVFQKDKVQDINLNPLKLGVIVTYKIVEKITTNFESSNDEDVINKVFLN